MDVTNKVLVKEYNKNDFRFYEYFRNHLSNIGVDEMEQLHKKLPKDFMPNKKVNVQDDQDLKIYEYLYSIDRGYSLKSSEGKGDFLKECEKFVQMLSKDVFCEDLVYQAKPTLRVHFHNNLAVGGFHRDRDYNHPIEEINIWVPITRAYETCTIWIETAFNNNDFKPISVNYGEFIIFDSGLKHGNHINRTGISRLSFDLRVIPLSKWNSVKLSGTSIDQNKSFEIGDYYEMMSTTKEL